MNSPDCDCLDEDGRRPWSEKHFHAEKQDIESRGWRRLLDLVETAAADGREEFAPARELGQDIWEEDVVTLPRTIAKLKSVRRFVVGRSSLVRIPSEIGEMENLEQFDSYTSHRLHWYPYEVTRPAANKQLGQYASVVRKFQDEATVSAASAVTYVNDWP